MQLTIQQAAAVMGRSKTPRKAAAARKNGKLGGRPPKNPKSEQKA